MLKRQITRTKCRNRMLIAGFLAAGVVVPGLANAVQLPVDGSGPVEMLTELHVKPAALKPFLKVMRENVAHARTEPGNLAFDIFQTRDDATTLYVLEQWQDPKFAKAHLTQPTLLAMHKAAKEDLTGTISPMVLHGLSPTTGDRKEKPIGDAAATQNVLVYLSLKPNERQTMIDGFTKTVPTFRAAPGNIAFDVFQDAADPDTMVQLERWTNADSHNANLKRPVIGEIRGVFAQTLAKPLMSHRALLKDVSESAANG